MPQYLVNEKTKRKFQIVSVDKVRAKIKLKGDLGVFEEDYDRDKLKKLGYTLVTKPEKETTDAI